MDKILLLPIFLPVIAGVICFLLPRRARSARELLALVTSLAVLGIALFLFSLPDIRLEIPWLNIAPGLQVPFDLLATPYARLTMVAGAAFAFLVAMYSVRFMRLQTRHGEYYAYLLWALGMAAGSVLANNFIIMLFFWELLGLTLYLMVLISGDTAVPSATKTLIINGSGDLLLLLGIVFLWLEAGTLTLSDFTANPVLLSNPLSLAAFLLMMVGAFTKAGVIPLHTWIPAISTQAPLPVMSYFTALDKLLGIYLLARLSIEWFVLADWLGLAMMAVGAATILTGVLMAVMQHDYRRMLAFHSVSQVGYMVLGIGTGTPVGVIGGLFHMLNMVLLKGNLFLCGGSVQYQTGRTKFEDLGGLARAMPWTFACTLVASLGISGVPPFNAFVSKWLVYQGILQRGGELFPIFLVAAMFGSALTLASFIKLLYSMFWGERPKGLERVIESGATMLVPLVVLALFSVAFGVFYRWPVASLIAPLFGGLGYPESISGLWQSDLAAVLLLVSLLAGALFYLISRVRLGVETEVFVGGEALDPELYRVRGTHFYGPVKEFGALKQLYPLGERGAFDLYNYGARGVIWTAKIIYEYIDQALGDFYQEVIPSLLALTGQILRLLNTRLVLTRILWLSYLAGVIGINAFPENADVLYATRVVACIGMVCWGIMAWVETDLSRLLILAATSQLGFIVLGVTLSPGVAISYLITGSIALAVLFLCGRSICRSLKTTEIDRMSGLAARMPGRFLIFLLAALWLSGLPPFGSFFSKYLLGVAAGEISPFLTIVITGSAILTLAYLLRPIRRFLRIV